MGPDHGTASAHFVAGGRGRGGLFGQAPKLGQLEGGNLIHGVDFRSVCARVIQRHCGLDTQAVPGARYPALDFIRA